MKKFVLYGYVDKINLNLLSSIYYKMIQLAYVIEPIPFSECILT